MKAPTTNTNVLHELREAWLRAAVSELRPHFARARHPLPEHIRTAIAFPSTGRKGQRRGECWHSASSEDGHYEIFIRADLSDPLEILSVLVKELVHTTLPADAGHGKSFKAAALRIGLQGPMRKATPGVLLAERLAEVATALGPLPHARLHISETPLVAVAPAPAVALNLPKKQRARMHKAECANEACGYVVRVAAKPVRDIGPPHCPKHGAMTVSLPPEEAIDEDEPKITDEVIAETPRKPRGRDSGAQAG